MTRFQQEISGMLGDFWVAHAQKELNEISKDLCTGRITIDNKGIARNCIGRVLMSDMMEKVSYVSDKIDIEATKKAREEEVHREIAEYRKNYTGPSEEELAEMRAEFGPGAVVVNILTGDRIRV